MPFVIQSGSKQYTVTPGQKFVVDRLKNDLGEVIDLPLVYSYGTTKGATSVQAKIVLHQKGKKIRVVKYKNKNNYHKQSGYRHYETILEILGNEEVMETVAAVKETKAKPAKAEKAKAVIETVVEPVELVTEVKEIKAPKKKTVSDSDDFKKIEGIGAKIEEILNAAGINTFAELAAASVDTLKEILAGAGPRYSIHDPSSWPEQSTLGLNEKWDELKTLQDTLKGGKAE